MREILFRGKRVDNGEWVEGLPFFEENRCYIIEDLFICDEYQCTGAVNSSVIPETVGQFTGLTDKNGKKIFEGDIVRCKYANVPKNEHIQKVVFEGCKFMAEFSEGGCYSELYDGSTPLTFKRTAYMNEIEVIGNIHDNPELLKDGVSNGKS